MILQPQSSYFITEVFEAIEEQSLALPNSTDLLGYLPIGYPESPSLALNIGITAL